MDTVFRFIYFRVGNRQLAEDLTADTFLRALKRIGSFTWQGRDLGAWLVTIARNLVADHFKSGRYRLEVTTGDVLDAEREDRGPEGSPEAAVVEHITNVALLTAVKQLNPEQQECIVLRFLQGSRSPRPRSVDGQERRCDQGLAVPRRTCARTPAAGRLPAVTMPRMLSIRNQARPQCVASDVPGPRNGLYRCVAITTRITTSQMPAVGLSSPAEHVGSPGRRPVGRAGLRP